MTKKQQTNRGPFDGLYPQVDFDKCTREWVTQEWIAETDNAIEALMDWRRKLQRWAAIGDTKAGFAAAIQDLADAGLLLDWADRNKAGGGLDALADAVIVEEVAT